MIPFYRRWLLQARLVFTGYCSGEILIAHGESADHDMDLLENVMLEMTDEFDKIAFPWWRVVGRDQYWVGADINKHPAYGMVRVISWEMRI